MAEQKQADNKLKDMNISICGDVCSECPRYIATRSNDIGELEKVAELWFRVGFRDSVVSAGEMQCNGCNRQKPCGYGLNRCEQSGKGNNCGECPSFPCAKVDAVLEKTDRVAEECKTKCSATEYESLRRAFFGKREILTKISRAVKPGERTEP